MELCLVKRHDGLFALAYDSDWEKAQKIKVGEVYKCNITKPRNYKFHKKFWALINMVYENQDRYQHLEELREDLIVAAGFFTIRLDLEGRVVKKADSISFAEMDEFKFSELYERIKDVITIHFRITSEQIEEEIHQYY